MKFLFFAIIIYMVLINQNHKLPQCTLDTAKLATGPRVWVEQTSDGSGQNTYTTRALHNKVSVFISEISKCYVNFYEPLYIFKSVGLLGTFFWVYLIYHLVVMKRKMAFLILAVLPLFPIYNLFTELAPIIHKSIAVAGSAIFINKKL